MSEFSTPHEKQQSRESTTAERFNLLLGDPFNVSRERLNDPSLYPNHVAPLDETSNRYRSSKFGHPANHGLAWPFRPMPGANIPDLMFENMDLSPSLVSQSGTNLIANAFVSAIAKRLKNTVLVVGTPAAETDYKPSDLATLYARRGNNLPLQIIQSTTNAQELIESTMMTPEQAAMMTSFKRPYSQQEGGLDIIEQIYAMGADEEATKRAILTHLMLTLLTPTTDKQDNGLLLDTINSLLTRGELFPSFDATEETPKGVLPYTAQDLFNTAYEYTNKLCYHAGI